MKKYLILIIILISSVWSPILYAEKAILAGGCFWCMESDFEGLPGVLDVVSGFTGGSMKNPTYNGNHQGHYEAVEVTYDAELVSYQALLDHFWVNIDPFDAQGQFCDKGHSYLSAIFVSTPEERQLAEQSRQRVIGMFPGQEVITPVLKFDVFYPIKGDESNHQDYYKNNPIRYKLYRTACRRDARLEAVWGDLATH